MKTCLTRLGSPGSPTGAFRAAGFLDSGSIHSSSESAVTEVILSVPEPTNASLNHVKFTRKLLKLAVPMQAFDMKLRPEASVGVPCAFASPRGGKGFHKHPIAVAVNILNRRLLPAPVGHARVVRRLLHQRGRALPYYLPGQVHHCGDATQRSWWGSWGRQGPMFSAPPFITHDSFRPNSLLSGMPTETHD